MEILRFTRWCDGNCRSARVASPAMSGSAVLVWVMLSLALVVLVGITVYVDSWRRTPKDRE